MTQLDLFDVLRVSATIRPVEPHGSVIQCAPDETLTLPHPRMAWPYARIELHRHTDGKWMWSTSFQCGDHGNSYRVGPKWGKFAETRDDALFYACAELRSKMEIEKHADAKLILSWASSTAPGVQ